MSLATTKTSNSVIDVSPELKEQAETVLNKLQIPVSTALNMFLQQVVTQQRIPFEVTTKHVPTNDAALTAEQFNKKIQKGFDDFKNNEIFTPEEVQEKLVKNRRS